MAYPQAPWTIKGYSLVTFQLLNIKEVRPFVPSELEIVTLWPGKTLGGVYVASYSSGSTLEYNELIVFNAITRYKNRFGVWVSHIYVDNPDSMAGGQAIWGLPKELAQFTWHQGEQTYVHVHQGNQLLCSLSYDWQLPQWRQPLIGASFSTLGSNLLFFRAQGEVSLRIVGGKLQVPAPSPFFKLGFR